MKGLENLLHIRDGKLDEASGSHIHRFEPALASCDVYHRRVICGLATIIEEDGIIEFNFSHNQSFYVYYNPSRSICT